MLLARHEYWINYRISYDYEQIIHEHVWHTFSGRPRKTADQNITKPVIKVISETYSDLFIMNCGIIKLYTRETD